MRYGRRLTAKHYTPNTDIICPHCKRPVKKHDFKLSLNTGQMIHIPQEGEPCYGVI